MKRRQITPSRWMRVPTMKKRDTSLDPVEQSGHVMPKLTASQYDLTQGCTWRSSRLAPVAQTQSGVIVGFVVAHGRHWSTGLCSHRGWLLLAIVGIPPRNWPLSIKVVYGCSWLAPGFAGRLQFSRCEQSPEREEPPPVIQLGWEDGCPLLHRPFCFDLHLWQGRQLSRGAIISFHNRRLQYANLVGAVPEFFFRTWGTGPRDPSVGAGMNGKP